MWHWLQTLRGTEHEHSVAEVLERTEADEKQIVGSAVRTDLVLSTEIMLIALANVDTDSWGMRLAILIVVAVLMTVIVYGVLSRTTLPAQLEPPKRPSGSPLNRTTLTG